MTDEKKGIKCNCCLVIGIIVLALGLFADMVGIGGGPGYGWKQILMIGAGAVLIVCALTTSKSCKCKKS